MKRAVLAFALALALPAQTQLDPKILEFQKLRDLPWKNDGQREQIILHGDPTKPGLYAAVLKWPPGTGTKPHTHPTDRLVAVISGTWWVATGAQYDMSKTVPMPAGTYLIHKANQPHFDGAKDEEVIVYVSGMGPGTTHYLE